MLAAAITGAGSQPTSSPAPHQEWGLVNVACASLRAEPRHGAELETQATLGTPVLLDTICSGEWRIATLPDGYRAWMHTSAYRTLTDDESESWRKGKRVIVTHPYGETVCSDTLSSPLESAVTDATLGAIFCGTITPGSRFCEVKLPDGRTGYLPTASVDDFASWSERPMNVDGIIRTARSMNGVTYLWGGTMPKALDCSGFTQVCYRNSGTLLPRNASSQANICEPVSSDTPADWATGDLLFFGPGPDTTRITHVGIYIGSGRYIHCSGMVMTSSINQADSLYLPRRVLAVRRINRNYNRLSNHPWYF